MAFYLVKPALHGAVFVVTKVPRSGPKVDYERIPLAKEYDWKLHERQFWLARVFTYRSTAEKALAIVHAAGHEEFIISEKPWKEFA